MITFALADASYNLVRRTGAQDTHILSRHLTDMHIRSRHSPQPLLFCVLGACWHARCFFAAASTLSAGSAAPSTARGEVGGNTMKDRIASKISNDLPEANSTKRLLSTLIDGVNVDVTKVRSPLRSNALSLIACNISAVLFCVNVEVTWVIFLCDACSA